MKTSLLILTLLSLIVLSACSFGMSASNKELDKLNNEYGGVYIFDKKLREEIIQREKERDKFMDDWFKTHKLFTKDDLVELNNKFPQVLSNGCKYFLEGFNFDDVPEYAYYENKIKEYMGEQNYYTLRPFLGISSYYQCGEKKYPLTFVTRISYDIKSYGLFGDEAAGFRLSQWRTTSARGKKYFHYLINGKFIRGEEINGKNFSQF